MELLVITRRTFVAGASAIAILAALDVATSPALWAQDATPAGLMTPPGLGDRVLGKDDAPVTVIEYASMTCPHCASFHETTYPELKKRYIDTGKVRFIFREFPLDTLAAAASMLARCADQEKFFPLIETLFQRQRQWAVQQAIPPLLAIAKQAGFTEEKFNACLSDQKILDALEAERNRASEQFGVNSTPSIFVNGKLHRGGISIEEIAKLIDPLIKS